MVRNTVAQLSYHDVRFSETHKMGWTRCVHPILSEDPSPTLPCWEG